MHVIGTAGHVDHGKSALVKRLTGIDPDRFAEEKRRGLTIDLGFAWLKLPSGREIGLIDVPGHERFIKNMLAGAGGITVCLFVVAANEGWMPQSAEHLAIIDVLGVSAGVVALTKADTVDADVLELASAEIDERITSSALRGASIVACSALTGAGIDALIAALDAVVAVAPPAPDVNRPRLWVDRSFSITGAGTVVTGTLAGGALGAGDEVEIAPERRRARIRTIQSHKKPVARIGPGNRVALNLAGLERSGAQRGDAIVKRDQWRATTLIDARLVVPEHTGAESYTLEEKGSHLMYAGSAETPVRIKLMGRRQLKTGEFGFAQVYLRDPLPLVRGDRFVLRDAGRSLTPGGGTVLDPLAEVAGRNDAGRIALLEKLSVAPDDDALAAIVEAEGAIEATAASLRSGVDLNDLGSPGAERLPDGVVSLGHMLMSARRTAALGAAVRESLADHHSGRPLERGMPRTALRASLGEDPDTFDALLSSLADVIEEDQYVRLSSHRVTLAPDQQRQKASLLKTIEAGGFTPPKAKELDADHELVRALADSGEIVKVGDFYLTSAQTKEARRKVRDRIERSGPVTVAEIRDLLATTRKYAVPLAEWLDQSGATRRQGDVRALGPDP